MISFPDTTVGRAIRAVRTKFRRSPVEQDTSDTVDEEPQQASAQRIIETERLPIPREIPPGYTVQTFYPSTQLYPDIRGWEDSTMQQPCASSTAHQAPGRKQDAPVKFVPLLAPVAQNSPLRTTIRADINGLAVPCLYDTGAQMSIIHTDVIRQLKLPKSKLRPSSIQAESVCRKQLALEGEVGLTITIAGKTFDHDFAVWSKCPCPLIVGTDLMIKTGPITIDHAAEKFWFEGEKDKAIPLLVGRRPFAPLPVRLITVTDLPPRTITPVLGKTDRFWGDTSVDPPPVEIQFEGHPQLLEKSPIIIPQTLGILEGNSVVVLLQNPTLRDITLYPDTLLGSIVLLTDPSMVAQMDSTEESDPAFVPGGTHEAQFDAVAQGDQDSQTPYIDKIPWESVDLTQSQKGELVKLILKYPTAFSQSATDIGLTDLMSHDIDTAGARPVFTRQYPIPYAYREQVRDQISKLRDAGVVEKSECGYWNSPIVVVKCKTFGEDQPKIRICLDLREVNKIIRQKMPVYPMPRITDILTKLGKAKYMSILDLKQAYNTIRLTERAKDVTSFQVEGIGRFRYTRLPFGLASAGFAFQQLIELALDVSNSTHTASYLDDIIVYSSTFEEHLKHLEDVFIKLSAAGVKLSPEKSQFCRKEVEYLGHLITPQGVKPTRENVRKILDFPVPRNVKMVRAFLSLAGYYRRFIQHFSAKTHVLSRLTEKDNKFAWTPEHQECFEALKKALTDDIVLAYPQFELPFVVASDASDHGIGGVLSQVVDGMERPIAFFSRALRKYERNYPITHKEGLAAVEACNHFDVYLHGSVPFTLITDHAALKQIFEGTKSANA